MDPAIHDRQYQEFADLMTRLEYNEANEKAREIVSSSTSGKNGQWQMGYQAAKWMLLDRGDPSPSLRFLGIKQHGSYEDATNLVYNLSNLPLPPCYQARLYSASLYAAGKTLNTSLMNDVLSHQSKVNQAIDKLDPGSSRPDENQIVRRLSLDLAKINTYILTNEFELLYDTAKSSVSSFQHLRYLESSQKGAVGIVCTQSIIKALSIIFADALLSRDIALASRAQAKITRCSLAMHRCWRGRVRRRSELAYIAEGLIPMHLALISRQALKGVKRLGFDNSIVATSAFSIMSFVFRPEGPRERVQAAESLIQTHIGRRLCMNPSLIETDTALAVSGRMTEGFISAI